MEIIKLGNTPISEDAPAGKDVKYEPSFESLSQEIAKLSSPSVSSGINWDTVINLSVQILEKESKHLQVVSYLNYGLMKTQGLEGLCQGIHVLKELLKNYWETMFPPKKRMKGRRGIIAWWSEKTIEFISSVDPVIWEKEKRDILIDDMNFIDKFLGESMEDAPLLIPMIKRIKETISEKAIEAAGENAPEPGTGTSKGQPATKKMIAEPLLDSDTDASAMVGQGLSILGKSISGLKKKNKYQPLPYRLSRIAAWATLDKLPVATGGKTMIPPPDDQIISSITGLYDSGNWEALTDSCEGRVRQFLFWLDLSRYVAESMEQMNHPEVALVIEAETALFVQTLKGIEKLSFSDGTPFADSATLEWIKQLKSKDAGKTDSSDAGGTGGINQIISQQMIAAQQLIKEKQLDKALLLFQEHLLKAKSERERFLWKTGLCQLLINSKQLKIAASYIDDILENINKFNLETWEPENAIKALSLVLTGLRLQKKGQHEQLIETIIKRISMLDPVKALQIV
ncbi:MAG: type VI secretion system protein TssA [Deltaproteobacteria bacterium]|uniref:type VI secretion system protein TssA n=1 Tax=Desulfobacula sp. TaxID=2593537 RepID=UPI0019C9BDCD|nr:type VI secretion system protein TssA [Candidatus Desulfobacula maris]MBL6993045.1 type VI secretion system protein TssA [Desulfobacula sp.]